MIDATIIVQFDGATPLLRNLQRIASDPEVRANAMTGCVELTRNYLMAMPSNRMGWPSTGFYKKCAAGTTGALDNEGFHVLVENADAPGAIKFRYLCHVNGSGTINMKDKLLTIPARAEFYGRRATDFDNLKFAMFASGAKALVIGKGGTGLVDFGTGKSHMFRGTGPRSASVVAYWLVSSVTQSQGMPVVPSNENYIKTIKKVYLMALRQLTKGAA